ncbi:hypothetical protein FPV67DRAFT_1480679 [Lyophyllum atratum]|nr:hypothetical protein FPV67DRAFT_1480679 [Lyophyllum atratum]
MCPRSSHLLQHHAIARVFEQAGWVGRQAILMTGVNAIVYLLSTLPPWYLVDHWGRRPILLSGAGVMSLALCATGFWMFLDVAWTPNAVVVSVIVYNAAFGYSWGPIPWLYPPEIMPLSVRAKGVSLSTCTNWAFNYIVGAGTPWLQDVIHWRLYFMHAFFCVCSSVLVYFLYPETIGLPLEEMDTVFGETPDTQDQDMSAYSPRTAFICSARLEPSVYPPKPEQTRRPTDSEWLGRLFQYGAPGGSSYRPIEEEELAPLNSEDRNDSRENGYRDTGPRE